MIRGILKTTKRPLQAYHLKVGLVRNLASQTLLSRTDYQKHSAGELRDELHKRGIVTRSNKKSLLIDKLLEFERRRISGQTAGKDVVKQAVPGKKAIEGSPTVVSSPTKIVARLMSAPDGERTETHSIETGSSSASLASPLTTMKSAGHEAQTWPASINLPTTAVEEPLGTVIPFIPDNWDSHQQSHAPQLVDIKPNPADLQVSTASHPSTLPEGGPSLVAPTEFSTSKPTTASSSSSSSSSSLVETSDLPSISPMVSKILGSISGMAKTVLTNDGRGFEPEDRALNEHERNGLVRLLAFFGGAWLFSGIMDPISACLS